MRQAAPAEPLAPRPASGAHLIAPARRSLMDLSQPQPSVESIDEDGAPPTAATPNPFGAAAVLAPFASDELAGDLGSGAQPPAGTPSACTRLSGGQASCGSIDEERAAEAAPAAGPAAEAAAPVPIPAASAGQGARRPRVRLEGAWDLPPAPGEGASPAAGSGPGSAGGSAAGSLPMSWNRSGGVAVMASPFKGFVDAPGSPRRAPDAPAEANAGPDPNPAPAPRPAPRPASAPLRPSNLRAARSGPGDLSCRNAGATPALVALLGS